MKTVLSFIALVAILAIAGVFVAAYAERTDQTTPAARSSCAVKDSYPAPETNTAPEAGCHRMKAEGGPMMAKGCCQMDETACGKVCGEACATCGKTKESCTTCCAGKCAACCKM